MFNDHKRSGKVKTFGDRVKEFNGRLTEPDRALVAWVLNNPEEAVYISSAEFLTAMGVMAGTAGLVKGAEVAKDTLTTAALIKALTPGKSDVDAAGNYVFTGNQVLDLAAITATAHVTRAAAAGVTLTAQAGGSSAITVTFDMISAATDTSKPVPESDVTVNVLLAPTSYPEPPSTIRAVMAVPVLVALITPTPDAPLVDPVMFTTSPTLW